MTFTLVIGAVLAKWFVEVWLERLNQRHVRAEGASPPEPLAGKVDASTYGRSVRYTLAKSRFSQMQSTWETFVLLILLYSGVLPSVLEFFLRNLGMSPWSMALFLLSVGLALALTTLPLDWQAQFDLEARFGFNTTSPKLWWMDRAKGYLLAAALGYPLLVVILALVDWAGSTWWLWAWGTVLGFRLIMAVLAPSLILPLFNKFTPLAEGPLRSRLMELAGRTGFSTRGIQVMDGSRRSKHSNAFFTGFGRFRKIVLFDTLLDQLEEREIEAVLAHEIGHWRRGHVPKMIAMSAAGLLLGFAAAGWIANQSWFAAAFGFDPGQVAPVLLLFGLLGGVVTFWFAPVANALTRHYEYQADAFAAQTLGGGGPLGTALRKLSEKNLSNLNPHPIYSAFYYSHPTLLEREAALDIVAEAPQR